MDTSRNVNFSNTPFLRHKPPFTFRSLNPHVFFFRERFRFAKRGMIFSFFRCEVAEIGHAARWRSFALLGGGKRSIQTKALTNDLKGLTLTLQVSAARNTVRWSLSLLDIPYRLSVALPCHTTALPLPISPDTLLFESTCKIGGGFTTFLVGRIF